MKNNMLTPCVADELIRQLALPGTRFKLANPSFGYLTTKQCGLATWMHLDHHLRQFGV